MNATGEKYTTARDKISSEDSQSAPSSSVYAWQALAGVARLPYEDFDMWMPTEVIPGEDPRTLNGLHIEKGIGKHYDVWKIYDEPHVDLETDEEVNIEADERFRRVDSGGWFDVTPTIRCSVDSIYGTGWRIQLHRYGIRSEKTTVIQSATYRESVTVPIDDGYLASALALHTVYRFLTDVQSGHYRLWKSSEAGTRALFPSAAVEGGWRSGGEIVDRGFDLAQGWRQLEIERERAVRGVGRPNWTMVSLDAQLADSRALRGLWELSS